MPCEQFVTLVKQKAPSLFSDKALKDSLVKYKCYLIDYQYQPPLLVWIPFQINDSVLMEQDPHQVEIECRTKGAAGS